MFAGMKKVARAAAVAVTATAFVVIAPTGTAFAMNQVQCNPNEDFLKIKAHVSNSETEVFCFANAGTFDLGNRFVEEISTGNNDVFLHDANGDVVKFERFTATIFPNRPPKVTTVEIL